MNKRLKHNFLLLFLVTFVGLLGQAKFYAKGSATAYTGRTYSITFVLENGQGKNFRMPKSYPGFEIVGGPSQSSNYSWVNGKTTRSLSYTYYLQAKKEGVFTIPSASVEVKNESLTTKPIKVTVKKGPTVNNNRQQRNRNTRNRRQQQNQQAPQNNDDWKEQISKNLYVKMYVDKHNPFVGEQVTLYLKLYQRVQTFQTQITEMPEFNGFWKKDFQLQTNKWEKEEVDGVWYNTMMINKYALFPQREGSFDLSPIKLVTLVQLRTQAKSNSIWDQFFGSYENKEYPFQSNGVKINVKALPTTNIPENFSGAVGFFKYTAKIDSLNCKTGKAITLKTRITGTGNIMMIDAPEVSFPEEFEVYDPQEKDYISKKSTYINGTKKFDYLMIPNKPGQFVIDSLPFSFFDLKTKTYKTIYSEGFTINVQPSADYVEDVIVEDVNKLDSDIKGISTAFDFNNYKRNFVDSDFFWILWGSPILIFFLLLIAKNKINNYKPDIVGRNRKKANKIALSKLKNANNFLIANDKKAFYNEIVRTLWDYASLKLNMKIEELSKENIGDKLLGLNVSEKVSSEYIELIEKSEMAVFSPIGELEMLKDYKSAKELIINIESELV